MNGTVLTFIPKKSKPSFFNYFQPIFLYDVIYKLITNILANRLKKGLSRGLSKEQFGFLYNIKILDAIGTAQEGLHAMKVRKIASMIMKLDLAKWSENI